MITKSQQFSNNNLIFRLLQIIGALYIIDGASLLLRGIVGGLFLLHQQSSVTFIIIYILHVYLGGVLYTYFGYGIVANKPWATKIPGIILAISSVIWAVPSFGADYFTAILGASYLLIIIILKRKNLI